MSGAPPEGFRGEPDAVRDEPAAPPEDSTIWRRVHKATPLINAWKTLGIVVAVVLFNALDSLGPMLAEVQSLPLLQILVIALAVVVVVVGFAFAFSWFSWRRMRYAVGEDAVYFHSGILFRNQRHARLNRIQGVDIIRPLLGRLVGLSAVNIETAGGAQSNIRVQFLKDDEAERLRAEVLGRAAGLRAAVRPGARPGEAPVYAQAPEREVYALRVRDQLLSLVLSPLLVLAVVGLLTLIPAVLFTDSLWSLIAIIPASFAFAGALFTRFDSEFNFTLAISPDGLRLRHGLLSTRAQTLPPGRIQAVRVSQPLLWRARDWWRVEVNVAGYGQPTGNQEGNQQRNVLVPVATRAEALNAIWLILPDLGTADPDAVLAAALTGTLGDAGFLHSPPSARWVDPVKWRRNGLLITRTALIMRNGRLIRTVSIVPHERTQSLAIQQGPWERRLGLADFRADSVVGPVTTRSHHLPAPLASRILFEQAVRAREARAKEGPEEWMRRVGVAAPAAESPAAESPAAGSVAGSVAGPESR